ncbi:anti-sigma factor family protein [Pseudomonas protegens]|uniref:Transmembrane regulator PrtR n=1 Tax=Pseudomonas protegens (strain DSM 19095 / LMG 27888 / CFBP 6595 / CHA0) TaxID=1124983 RepID=A0A2C9EQ38_PSEPH|nr:anti-sigma factor [Pseudomonas protegens]AGL85773.1 transmembrane regulator PrtR [Pseudomonas protegens CHA0]MBP5108019.1 anti-sigma factor [Pseudomonas protegens]MDK1399969.1 anti-sigma factor [Pseudomonas protegens]MDS9877745.1 anti-sigma factor [Pseudomonas protegens]QTU22840.1 anti-sigma factor [Pseudomonas protegens]
MISLPPSDSDLHAYVDHQLSEQDRRLLEHYLASHPQVAARVQAWQQDAQHLRAALGGALLQPANPALDPVQIRARLKQRSLRRLASAAVLLVAVGVGGLSGWQARELTLAGSSVLPMTDALQAYRLFAEQGMLPADFKVQGNQSIQAWLDRYFTQASPLPDLQGAGFRAVSGRLLSTEQGPAAMVLYEDREGRKVSFYIRPPGPQNKLLPPGSRREGPLQAQYWSGQGYNYAMVGPAEIPL